MSPPVALVAAICLTLSGAYALRLSSRPALASTVAIVLSGLTSAILWTSSPAGREVAAVALAAITALVTLVAERAIRPRPAPTGEECRRRRELGLGNLGLVVCLGLALQAHDRAWSAEPAAAPG